MNIDEVLQLIAHKAERATAKHHAIHSAHEGYAVILEELDEVKVEVWRCQHPTAPENHQEMCQELLEVAAMCVRTIVDLGL